MKDRIIVIEGDIVRQQVDVIINAMHPTMQATGMSNNIVHQAAGPELLADHPTLQDTPPGEAHITAGYRLPAQWIIHSMSPTWREGKSGEDRILTRCYRNCFALAAEYNFRTIAFPSVSTFAHGFPIHRASRIAIAETTTFLEKNPQVMKVIFVISYPISREHGISR
jgi:O-acetyl-ADP-ribose deacetylase (regulator of RNase III)